MENTLRRVLLIQPPLRRDGWIWNTTGWLSISTQRAAPGYPDRHGNILFQFLLFSSSQRNAHTHIRTFSRHSTVNYHTIRRTYHYKSARTMRGRDRIIDANPSNKIYGKIIEIKKNKVAPVLLTSYFSENLCTRHNKSTDWCRIRYTIYIHII
jgi:hypothetical protein